MDALPPFASVLLIALLPAAGNLIGAFGAEAIRVSARTLGILLHGAAGVAIAVVGVEILPRVLPQLSLWWFVPAVCLGAVASVGLARGVVNSTAGLERRHARAWMVYLTVAADLLSDGLMVGVGFTVSAGLGLLLGLAQIFANLPGGFVAGANLRDKRVSRRTRLLAAICFPLPALIGATLGYRLLRDAPTELSHAALAFTASVLLLTTIEDLVPEADEPRAPRRATSFAFTVGFVFFAILSLSID
ncbi:MAG TPA: ZIP family metal transporter [Pseudomonadales bacterium]